MASSKLFGRPWLADPDLLDHVPIRFVALLTSPFGQETRTPTPGGRRGREGRRSTRLRETASWWRSSHVGHRRLSGLVARSSPDSALRISHKLKGNEHGPRSTAWRISNYIGKIIVKRKFMTQGEKRNVGECI